MSQISFTRNPTQSHVLPLAVTAEDELEEILYFRDPNTRSAFAEGVEFGANLYGSGSCSCYQLPEEISEAPDAALRESLEDEWKRIKTALHRAFG